MTNIRVESDSFGELKVPADKYFGTQTARLLGENLQTQRFRKVVCGADRCVG